MRDAIRDIESLLHQHKRTLRTAQHPQLPSNITARLSTWLDSGAPALIAVTIAALVALAVGLASAAFAFMPTTTVPETVITKTDPLRTRTPAEIADKGYSQLKDKSCQVAFGSLSSTADRVERLDVRLKAEGETPTAALASPSDTRAGKRQRKHEARDRRYRTSSSGQESKRQPSLLGSSFVGASFSHSERRAKNAKPNHR